MAAGLPDPETLRAVLTLATQAPSVRNSQPWRWRVGPQGMDLYADPGRPPPTTDSGGRDLMLSCGASLHHCTVALAAMGWRATVRRLPGPVRSGHLATVTVARQAPGDLDIMLAAAIGRRRSDRRAYSSWPVPWGDVALMGARAARAGVMLRQVELMPRLSAMVAEAVARYAAGEDHRSEAAARGRRRGRMPDNGVLVALGTEADDDLARLRAGEATSLVLLSATAMGLATCAVSEPLEIAETREAVRADVFGATGYPQILMRVGWAPVDAEPLPATPRRPLPEVADWVQSAARRPAGRGPAGTSAAPPRTAHAPAQAAGARWTGDRPG